MKIESLAPGAALSPARRAADKLEGAFLEEMMKYAFPKPESGGFVGGVGEEQFSSFLAREHAAMLAQSLDLGFEAAMKEGGHG